MPTPDTLSPGARKELVLRALQGESAILLAHEFGVTRGNVYYHVKRAKEQVSEELPYWQKVRDLVRG